MKYFRLRMILVLGVLHSALASYAAQIPADTGAPIKKYAPSNTDKEARLYVTLAKEDAKAEEASESVMSFCSLGDFLRLEDLANSLNTVHPPSRMLPSLPPEQFYPVVGLFYSHKKEAEPVALERISDSQLNLKQKTGALVFFQSISNSQSQGDKLQFFEIHAQNYEAKAALATFIKASLFIKANNATAGTDASPLIYPQSRIQEISQWSSLDTTKIEDVKKRLEAENDVYNSSVRADIDGEIKSLQDLRQNHFQASSSLVVKSLAALPGDKVFGDSLQADKLRKEFASTFASLGPTSAHSIIEAIVLDGQEKRLRTFLLSCLVGSMGSKDRAGQALDQASADYTKRAQTMRDFKKSLRVR